MSLKECKNVETNRYELEVTVDGATFEKEIANVCKRQAKNINVPGFRKGKAPRAIIEKIYGEAVFYEDAVENLYPEALDKAIEEAGLKVIRDKIDLDIVSIGKDGFTFKAVVTTYPEVSIKDYKKLKFAPKSVEVTDEIIDADIDAVRMRNARTITVEDRAAQAGDITVIDFEGFKDGVPFDGGKAENYNLTLGDGQFIPGFEDQIVGHKAGEEFTITVTFPEEYPEETLAGKEVNFEIKLHEIKMRELPEVDDDFVKDVSDKETVAEYREEIAAKAKERLEAEADRAKEQQICEQLVDLVVADIPNAMFETRIDNMVDNMKARLQSQGLSFDMYLEYTGMTEEDLRDQYRLQAENDVKLNLAVTKIAELENIEATDEQVEEEYKKLAEAYKLDADKVKAYIPEFQIKENIKLDAAMKLVMDNAKETKSTAKKTTRKTSTKKTEKKATEEEKTAEE